MQKPFSVTSSESGQKLLQFLLRRLDNAQNEIHRWIRTGQVRINGSRVHAFDRVKEGDLIRIPPFARERLTLPEKAELPPLLDATEDLFVFNKPAGLALHPGTGNTDCLTKRLAAFYADLPFCPTPVHRLDKETSGLVLVARNYKTLRQLCADFAAHDGSIRKEYLAWVAGICPWQKPLLLENRIGESDSAQDLHAPAHGKMQILPTDSPDGKKAELLVRCLEIRRNTSLLQILLLTGRTHQIRVQLAAQGFPLAGDQKYGSVFPDTGLKLHACRISLSQHTWEAAPPWTGRWKVENLPAILLK